jgi:phosphoserine phosphatase
MSVTEISLPSWRPGETRDAVLGFLEGAADLPRAERMACFDNDGTLWAERPNYVQLEFFVAALRHRVSEDPGSGRRPEYAALLAGDRAAVGELGLPRIALALTELFEGVHPDVFTRKVREFMATATHPTLDRPQRTMVYQPMLELIEELRRLEFSVSIVTGGGTEFVRAVSEEIYGVPPEAVVGTLIEYDFVDGEGGPSLLRSSRLLGGANEGRTKVVNIQTQLGRRPVLAAGNTHGDREMLDWAAASAGPGLALLVDHDDAEREFQYSGHAVSLAEDSELIRDTAVRSGWTVVSMARDWAQVFPRQSV